MVCKPTQSALYKASDKYGNNTVHIKKGEKNTQKTAEKIMPEKSPENYPENCPKNHPRSDPLSKIFSDRDMLLVAMLILFLQREKADEKLILALVFVLLG